MQGYSDKVVAFAAFVLWGVGTAAIYGLFAFTAWDADFVDWGGVGRFVFYITTALWTLAVVSSVELANDGEE